MVLAAISSVIDFHAKLEEFRMRSLRALFLSLTLFSCTFDLRSFAQTGTSISQAGFTIPGLSAGAVRNVPMSEEALKKVLVIEQCERDQSRQEGRRNLDIRGKQGERLYGATEQQLPSR